MPHVMYTVELEHAGQRVTVEREFGYPEFVDDGGVPEGLEYQWVDGNQSCDCNRLIIGGWKSIDEEIPCTDGRVKVRVTCRGEVLIDELS